MCLAQGPQGSDAGEARTRGPSVSSQALYHWATALPQDSLWSCVYWKRQVYDPCSPFENYEIIQCAQYRRHQTYNDALKNFSYPPELFHNGIVCLLLWPIPRSQRSLGHSLLKQKFSQKFFVFFVFFLFCFWVVFVFYFIKISKFAISGVMLKYERNQ